MTVQAAAIRSPMQLQNREKDTSVSNIPQCEIAIYSTFEKAA
jgi:hypothetical protein